MTVSAPFYVITRTFENSALDYFFNVQRGAWNSDITNASRFPTPQGANAYWDEWILSLDCIIAPYKACIGHNGQTVILPA